MLKRLYLQTKNVILSHIVYTGRVSVRAMYSVHKQTLETKVVFYSWKIEDINYFCIVSL